MGKSGLEEGGKWIRRNTAERASTRLHASHLTGAQQIPQGTELVLCEGTAQRLLAWSLVESLHHRDQQMLQIRVLLFREPIYSIALDDSVNHVLSSRNKVAFSSTERKLTVMHLVNQMKTLRQQHPAVSHHQHSQESSFEIHDFLGGDTVYPSPQAYKPLLHPHHSYAINY